MSRVHDMFPDEAHVLYGGRTSFTLTLCSRGLPGPLSPLRDGLGPMVECLHGHAPQLGPHRFASGTFSWMKTAGRISPSRPVPSRPGGLVCVDTKSQELSYSGNYYAFAHYAKLIRRGAHIFASSGDLPGMNHVAAENTDGSRVLVLTNSDSSQEQRVQCTLGASTMDLVLPPDSITSLLWS